MASNEMYSDNDSLLNIDGTMHYLSMQDGVEAYRPCPPELAALILENQQSQRFVVDSDSVLSGEKQYDQKERHHLSPRVTRALFKAAVAGVVLVGAHMGANYATTETLSMGRASMNVGQLVGDLWSDVTLPARIAIAAVQK